MRLDNLKPAHARVGLILSTVLVFAWHVRAGFDPTLGAIAFALGFGYMMFEDRHQRAKRAGRAPTPPAAPPPPRTRS